jgi:hypothetical protein
MIAVIETITVGNCRDHDSRREIRTISRSAACPFYLNFLRLVFATLNFYMRLKYSFDDDDDAFLLLSLFVPLGHSHEDHHVDAISCITLRKRSELALSNAVDARSEIMYPILLSLLPTACFERQEVRRITELAIILP